MHNENSDTLYRSPSGGGGGSGGGSTVGENLTAQLCAPLPEHSVAHACSDAMSSRIPIDRRDTPRPTFLSPAKRGFPPRSPWEWRGEAARHISRPFRKVDWDPSLPQASFAKRRWIDGWRPGEDFSNLGQRSHKRLVRASRSLILDNVHTALSVLESSFFGMREQNFGREF